MPPDQAIRIYLGLGTNLGDRLANLQAACAALPPRVAVRRSSSIYETAPWGYLDQPPFLNQVLEADTRLTPQALLHHIKAIEQRLGRTPNFRYGPRLIDIDILSYGSQVIDQPGLRIPHPHLPERAFVLLPLSELAPNWIHPQSHHSIAQLLSRVDRQGIALFHG